MRNVRFALLFAVGLSLSTACSFSSSRSWGSGGTNPGATGTGSGANHGKPPQNKGKPARQVSTNEPASTTPSVPPKATEPAPPNTNPTPVPAADPAPSREGRDDSAKPTREGRVDPPAKPEREGRVDPTPASGTTPGATLNGRSGSAAPVTNSKAAPKGLSAAPKQTAPQ